MHKFTIRPAAFLLAATLVLAGCAGESRRSGPLDAGAQRSLAAVSVDPAAAARMLSAYRASRGLGPVRLDPTLASMAQRQADAMAAADEMSHSVAGSFVSRAAAAGLDTVRAAENVGAGYMSLEDAFAAWRASAGHDANLLMPQATRFGIALAKDPATRYRVYWAMVVAAEPDRRIEPAMAVPPGATQVTFGGLALPGSPPSR